MSETSAGGSCVKVEKKELQGKMGIKIERFDMDLLLYSEKLNFHRRVSRKLNNSQDQTMEK